MSYQLNQNHVPRSQAPVFRESDYQPRQVEDGYHSTYVGSAQHTYVDPFNSTSNVTLGDPGTGSPFPPGPHENNPAPGLNEPWYGISFVEANKRVFTKAFRFKGFASRSEFWWANVGYAIVYAALSMIFTVILAVIFAASAGTVLVNPEDPGFVLGSIAISVTALIAGVIFWLTVAVLSIPLYALTVRRLHDAGFSGWFVLLGFVPFGSYVILVMTILETQQSKWRTEWIDLQA